MNELDMFTKMLERVLLYPEVTMGIQKITRNDKHWMGDLIVEKGGTVVEVSGFYSEAYFSFNENGSLISVEVRS